MVAQSKTTVLPCCVRGLLPPYENKALHSFSPNVQNRVSTTSYKIDGSGNYIEKMYIAE